jgi:hypothetical protein
MQLHKMVMEAYRMDPMPHIVIAGLGGMGKTEVVNNYGRAFSLYFDGIVFVIDDATARQRIRESFLRMVTVELNLGTEADFRGFSDPDLAATCYSYLSTTLKCKSLFIFDNAESVQEVMDFLPSPSSRGIADAEPPPAPFIILTSRAYSSTAWPAPKFNILRLEGLEPKESLKFLEQTLKYGSKEACSLLADELGHHPLALEHAAAFIRNGNKFCSVDTRIKDGFLPTLHSQPELVLNFNPNAAVRECYQDTVLNILKVTLGKLGPESHQLLTKLAFMGPGRIPVLWLLENGGNEPKTKCLLETLNNYSLFTILVPVKTATTYLQVRRLVSKWVRRQSTGRPDHATILAEVLDILAPRVHNVCTSIKLSLPAITSLTGDQMSCVVHSRAFLGHISEGQKALDNGRLDSFVSDLQACEGVLNHHDDEAAFVSQAMRDLQVQD